MALSQHLPCSGPHVTILDRPRFLYPVCQVSNKVEEEVILRDTDDLGTCALQFTHFSSSSTEFSHSPTQGPPGCYSYSQKGCPALP